MTALEWLALFALAVMVASGIASEIHDRRAQREHEAWMREHIGYEAASLGRRQ